jgi:hypothetical protein
MPLFESLRKMFVRRPEIRMPRRWPRIVMTDTSMLTLADQRREPVKLVNLSGGGARVRSSFSLPLHERVTLQLPLGAASRHSLPALVVYCRRDPQGLHYEGGLSFVGADREGIPEVLAFIDDEKRRPLAEADLYAKAALPEKLLVVLAAGHVIHSFSLPALYANNDAAKTGGGQ